MDDSNETLGEYIERTRPLSVYEQIDRLQVRGFVGLMVAGVSPIIGDALTGWVGWAVFMGGVTTVIYSLVAMGRVRTRPEPTQNATSPPRTGQRD